MLPVSDLAAGLAVLLPLLGAALVAGHLGARGLAPDVAGVERALAVLLCATAALLAAVILPGTVGLLDRGWVLLAGLGVAAAVAWRVPRGRWATGARAPARSRLRTSELPAAAAVIAVGACALAVLREVAGAPLLSVDALNFQLTVPADWIRDGDVWGLHQFIPDYSNATYPHHGNALLAAAVLPFSSTVLAQLVAVPFWVAGGAAAAAIGRELGAPRGAAVLAGTAFAALPVALRSGIEGAQTDALMLAAFGTGVLFLLRHHRTGDRGDLLLAGLGLGIALGTKWYALTSLAVVLALWAFATRRRLRRDAAPLVGMIALAGGFWLVRNWVQTGNPLFPQALPPLFDAPPDPLRALGGWTLAHYGADADVWRTYLGPAFRDAFGLGGAVLATTAALAGLLATRRGDRRAALVAAGVLGLTAAYWVTPYSAFGPEGRPVLAIASTRYGLPALLGAAALAAWLAGRGPRWSVAVQVALLAAVADGLRRVFDLGPGDVATGLVLAAALAAGVLLARRAPAAGVAAAAVALVAVALVARERADTEGYAPFDPAFAFIEARAPADASVGIAGLWTPDGVPPPLPAYGRRLGNEVAYVGEYRDGMLRRFTDGEAFARAARDRDLLLIGTGIPAGSDERAIGWAKAAGWRELTRSERLVLLGR